MFFVTPFVGLVVLAYAIAALFSGLFLGPEQSMAMFLGGEVFEVVLPSGDTWALSVGEMYLLAGLIALALEAIKSTSTTRFSIGNHGLSILTFVAAILLFLLVGGFGTATFFLLMAMAFIDGVTGMMVSIVAARRDIGVDQGAFGGDA